MWVLLLLEAVSRGAQLQADVFCVSDLRVAALVLVSCR